MTDTRRDIPEDVRNAMDEATDALYSALNLEGAASGAVRNLKAYAGLDVDYHTEKIRAAIKTLEGQGAQSS